MGVGTQGRKGLGGVSVKQWAAALSLFCFLFGIAGCTPEEPTDEREPLLYVNGEAVSEEEMAVLDGDTGRAVRMKVLQQWAEELGYIDGFSWDSMLEALARENESRAETAASGGVVYGPVEYTSLQYYYILMGDLERLIRDELSAAATQEDLRTFYEEHLEDYREIGEITAVVTVSTEKGEVIREETVTLSPANYRVMSERDERLTYELSMLWEGQEANWTDEYGQVWELRCTGRTPDTYEPFEDISGAVGEQYAGEQLELELERRTDESTIEDLRIIEGEEMN